ncbi:MAG TPA: hypothetical protein DF383_10965 [Deltaproteobacteria bacterium]|nr:hypothetical protein [Deltaproteobacteria bacterium]
MKLLILPKLWTLGMALVVILTASAVFAEAPAEKAKGQTLCTMYFSLKSWSVFYKSGKGYGAIHCDNGQKADVTIHSQGGGVSFGKYDIPEGEGKFSAVSDIQELYGKYGSVGGEGGAGKAAMSESLSKDGITLEIKGRGTGGGFGFDFGGLRISTMTEKDREQMRKETAD